MIETVLRWLNGIPKEYAVMFIGGFPLTEVRGAIPLGFYYGMPVLKVFWLAVLGNIIPMAPALLLFEPISTQLRKIPLLKRFFNWVFERTKKNSDAIQKYEALGLAIFVAVPLPMTGAWSGVVAASLFKIKFRYAFPAIVLGIVGAAVIVTALCSLGILTWKAVTG